MHLLSTPPPRCPPLCQFSSYIMQSAYPHKPRAVLRLPSEQMIKRYSGLLTQQWPPIFITWRNPRSLPIPICTSAITVTTGHTCMYAAHTYAPFQAMLQSSLALCRSVSEHYNLFLILELYVGAPVW
jgi:hypothetical protein